MSFEKLFESLDETVFTPELKESLKEHFDEAVQLQAELISESLIQEEIETLSQKSDEYITHLEEKAEEYIELKQDELMETLDKYLDSVVKEFVSEQQSTLAESISSQKSELMLEAFDAMLVTGGVDVARIAEAKEQESDDSKYTELHERYNRVVNENLKLKDSNQELVKMGLINELSEGLSIVEAEKFQKLASIVEYTGDESYVEKLETIRESVKGKKSHTDEVFTESHEDEEPEQFSFSHLI